MKLVGHFLDEAELVRNGGAPFDSGQVIEMWLRPFEAAIYQILPKDASGDKDHRLGGRKLPEEMPHVQSHRLELKDEPAEPEMEVFFC